MIRSILSFGFVCLLLMSCAEQKVNPEKDLTLPNFSFIGLSEPLTDREHIKVAVHVKIPYTSLQFIRDSGQFLARYEVAITIKDDHKERIAGMIWRDTLRLNAYHETRKTDNSIQSEKDFVVPAAALDIRVRVTDLYTLKSRVLTRDVDQSAMYVGDLALGNIVIMENSHLQSSNVLMDKSFYDVVDTLRFNVRLMGTRPPFKISYDLRVKNASIKQFSVILPDTSMIDSLLSFAVPLNDFKYSNYTLYFSAEDGAGNKARTRSNFRVRIRGIKFDVGDMDDAVKQLVYIADDKQIKTILSGNADEESIKFAQFWAALDPTPGTTENELMEEYYRRVSFSIEAFTIVQPGWRSDRGMIYILFGPPDEIQRGPFELDRKPYQIWEYYQLGKEFVFYDLTGFGDYRLDHTYLDHSDWRFRY